MKFASEYKIATISRKMFIQQNNTIIIKKNYPLVSQSEHPCTDEMF